MQLNDRVAVVTGAASGIGRGLADVLGRRGCHLALWDVNAEPLEESADIARQHGVRVTTAVVDVSDNARVQDAAAEAIDAHGHVDALLNNAGVTVIDSMRDVSLEDFEWVINVNFWGVVYGIRAFLPHLETRPEASIVNVSSVNAFLPFPHNGPYNCSKFAVCGLSETLHQELANTQITVSSVHPGGIRTNIVRDARFVTSAQPGEDHDAITRSFARMARTSPTQAAETIVRGMERKKKRILIGADAYLFERAKRIAPETSVGLIPSIMRQLAKFS